MREKRIALRMMPATSLSQRHEKEWENIHPCLVCSSRSLFLRHRLPAQRERDGRGKGSPKDCASTTQALRSPDSFGILSLAIPLFFPLFSSSFLFHSLILPNVVCLHRERIPIILMCLVNQNTQAHTGIASHSHPHTHTHTQPRHTNTYAETQEGTR